MSQNTSVDSSTRPQLKPALNPALQDALASLDVQLEDELARYRRQRRASRPATTPRSLSRASTRKPIELISTNAIAQPTQLPASGTINAADLITRQEALLQPTPKTEPTPDLASPANADTPPQPLNPLVPATIAKATATSEANPQTIPDTPNQAAKSPDLGGDLVHSPTQTPPDDYLESSAKLRQSLEEPQTVPQPQKRFSERILTPLGVGSLLLLLLSTATLTYILINPASRTNLGLNRWLGPQTPPTAQNPTDKPIGNGGKANNTLIVKGPNLAADEFSEVTIENLPHLEASPSPSPSPAAIAPVPNLPNSQAIQSTPPPVAPLPAVPGRVPDLPQAILSPTPPSPPPSPQTTPPVGSKPQSAASPATTSKPSIDSPKQQPSPTPTKPTPTSTPTAARGGYYIVVANYTGEPALQQVRTIVPEAYVENFPDGSRIQIGAFKRESEAKALVEQLQQQGISAEIRR